MGEGLWLMTKASPLLLAAPALAWLARGRFSRTSEIFVALWLAALPACLLPYGKMYGAHNNLIPLSIISALAPLSLAVDAWRSPAHAWVFGGVIAGASLLVGTGHFDARRFAPPAEVARAMTANLAEVRALPGTIACPVHPFLAHQLGKGAAQSSWLSFIDARAAGRPVDRERYVEDLVAQRADWIILTNMSVEWEGELVPRTRSS